MEPNPYQAPVTQEAPPMLAASNDEQIRREHLNREANIKGLGGLQLLGAIILIPTGIIQLVKHSADMVTVGITLGLGLVALCTGLGLYRLQPWARIVAAILAAIGLLGFPIGTLINGMILGVLLTKQSNVVFSADYKRIIAATPHVKRRISRVLIVLLIIFAVVVLAMVGIGAAAMFLK